MFQAFVHYRVTCTWLAIPHHAQQQCMTVMLPGNSSITQQECMTVLPLGQSQVSVP